MTTTQAASTPVRKELFKNSKSQAEEVRRCGSPVDAEFAELEREVVGAILADNTLFDLAQPLLNPADFVDPLAREMFAGITQIMDAAIEGVTIAEPYTVFSLPGVATCATLEEINVLRQRADTTPATFLSRANVLREHASNRRLRFAVKQAEQIAGANTGTVQEKHSQVASVLESSIGIMAGEKSKSAGSFAFEAVKRMADKAIAGGVLNGIPFGITELDRATGGAAGGQLIVVAARPSVGKSAFAAGCLFSMAEAGFPGQLQSYEMGGVSLADRLISRVSKIDQQKQKVGALTENEWEKVFSAAEYIATLPLQISDDPTLTLPGIRVMARRLHREKKLSCLVVDYLQIMPTAAKTVREQAISELSRGLKLLAMELQIPVIVLSQLNRDIERRANPRPTMADLRESGAIEQDADVILFIERDISPMSKTPNRALIIIGKQRSGPLVDIEVGFDGPTTTFYDLNTEAVSDFHFTTSSREDPLAGVVARQDEISFA